VGAVKGGLGRLRKFGDRIRAAAGRLKDRLFGRRKKSADKEQRKQERLDTAVRELQPKVDALLARGVSGLRLHAQLLYWRIRYRLTSLKLVGEGRSAQVVAKVNPESVVASAVRKVGAELHKMLVQVGEELMSDPDIDAQVRQIQADRAAGLGVQTPSSGYPAQSGTVRPGQSPAAEAAALKPDDPLRRGWPQEQVGIAPGAVVKEQHGPYPPGQAKVTNIEGSGHYDPDVAKALQDMRDSGLSAQDIRTGLYDILQGRKPSPSGFTSDQVTQLGGVARLMFTVEGGRHAGAFSTSFMAWELATEKGVTMKEVVQDLNPMSPGGATGDARASRVDPGDRTAAQEAGAVLHMDREKAVVIRYLEMLNADGVLFDTEDKAIEWIKTKFKEHLLARLRKLVTTRGYDTRPLP
jgi:hypothetical protein